MLVHRPLAATVTSLLSARRCDCCAGASKSHRWLWVIGSWVMSHVIATPIGE